MPGHRTLRVRELLRQALSEALRRECDVTHNGVVSVNDVEMGGDLKSAVAFVSILGNAEQKKTGQKFLETNRHRIQDAVAKSVVLRYVPRIKFIVDDSIERGNRVLQILEGLEKEQQERAQPGDE